MQKPINRKNKNYPKDFNLSLTNNNKKVKKQYTFNKQPSISDSLDDINDKISYTRHRYQLSKQVNPEEEHQRQVLKKNIKNTQNNIHSQYISQQQIKQVQQFQNIRYDYNKYQQYQRQVLKKNVKNTQNNIHTQYQSQQQIKQTQQFQKIPQDQQQHQRQVLQKNMKNTQNNNNIHSQYQSQQQTQQFQKISYNYNKQQQHQRQVLQKNIKNTQNNIHPQYQSQQQIKQTQQFQKISYNYNKQQQHQPQILKKNIKNTQNNNNIHSQYQSQQQIKQTEQFQKIPYNYNKQYQFDQNYQLYLQKKYFNNQKIKSQIAYQLLNQQKWKTSPIPSQSIQQSQNKYSQNILPMINNRNQSFDQGISKNSSTINRQSLNYKTRPLYLDSKSFVQCNIRKQFSPQKCFNNTALSLMGINRHKANKSSQSTSFWQKSDKNKITRYGISNKKQTQIYEHSLYPFKASSIKNLKVQIEDIVNNRKFKNNIPTLDEKNQQLQQNQTQNVFTQVDQGYYPELCVPNHKKFVKIDHRTSLSSLKKFLIHEIDPKKMVIKLPNFFLNPPQQFLKQADYNQQKFHQQACYIFSNLEIPIVGITIRRYSNCIVIVSTNICIVWHDGNDGKKYFGSWKTKYFDQGVKQGMGLQWSPGKSVYYGQFKQNKRHGFGVMKKSDGNAIISYWKKGKQINFGIEKNLQ